jgi:acyl dehydratase
MSAAAVKIREIRVGAEIVSRPYVLDAAAAKAYREGTESPRRRASRKSIHDDKDAARNAGFVAPIAAGEQTIAVIAQFLADNFGMRFVRGGRLEVALTKPVLFGDVLISHATIERVDHDRAELNIRVENQRGENVLAGSATIRTREA